MLPEEFKSEIPSNEQIIAELLPASIYPYLLDTASLLASENTYFQDAKNQSTFPDTMIMSAKDPEILKISVLHSDTTRNLLIENEVVRELSKEQITKLIHEKFPENAAAILSHYSQVASYFVSVPLQHLFLATEGVEYRAAADTTHDNLFNLNGAALRETAQTHVYFRVPSDKSFLTSDRRKEIAAISEENTTSKKREEEKWRGVWRFKYNIKLLNRARPEGFEIVAMGTDSALISNIMMNRDNPHQQMSDIVFKIREMEESMKELLKTLLIKVDVAKVSSNAEREKNASDKAEIAKLVLNKITEFKSGEITFDMLVKNLDEFHQLSKVVKKAGFLSKLKSELSKPDESPTAQKIGAFVRDLTAIKANIESIASPTRQAAPVVNVKNNIHASIKDALAVVQFYKNNRADNLSYVSKFFDSERGDFRAGCYIILLETAQTELSRAIIISALLKGGGTELRRVVAKSFGSEDILKVQSDLMNLIQKSLQGEFIMTTVHNVIDSIVTKAESNTLTTQDNFKEELTALSSFEKMEIPERSTSNRPTLR